LTCTLASSSPIDTRLQMRPSKVNPFLVIRRASPAPGNDLAIAVTTCGGNMSPYWLLHSP
jgi:hypothetical protein